MTEIIQSSETCAGKLHFLACVRVDIISQPQLSLWLEPRFLPKTKLPEQPLWADLHWQVRRTCFLFLVESVELRKGLVSIEVCGLVRPCVDLKIRCIAWKAKQNQNFLCCTTDIPSYSIDPWTTQGLGAPRPPIPAQSKIHVEFWVPQNVTKIVYCWWKALLIM